MNDIDFKNIKELFDIKDEKIIYDCLIKKALEPNKQSDADIHDFCHSFFAQNFGKVFTQRSYCSKVIRFNHPKIAIEKHGRSELGKYLFEIFFYNDISGEKKRFLEFKQHNYVQKCRTSNLNLVGGISHLFPMYYNRTFYDLWLKHIVFKVENSETFLNWYTQSLCILSVFYDSIADTLGIVKKPDELKINFAKREIYYRYGDEEFLYKTNQLI